MGKRSTAVKDLQYYQRSISKSQPLKRHEEQELARRVQNGDLAAVSKLVEANLRFAFSVALRHQGRGIPLDELVSLANLGLVLAAQRFKPNRAKFISFAVNWIEQPILLAMQHKRLVRVPCNRFAEINKLSDCDEILAQVKGEFPSAVDMQRELKLTPKKYDEVRRLGELEVSMDACFDEDDEGSENLFTRIPDGRISAEDELARKELLLSIDQAIEKVLNPNEKYVIRGWYGLGDGEELPLEDLGNFLGLTRERCRQIRNRAEEKLKNYLKRKLSDGGVMSKEDALTILE